MANTPFKMNGFSGFGNSPITKKPTLSEWWKKSKLGKDLKGLGEKLQSTSEKVKTSTPTSRSEAVSGGFSKASEKRSKASKKRSEQINKLKNRLFVPRKNRTMTREIEDK